MVKQKLSLALKGILFIEIFIQLKLGVFVVCNKQVN